VVNGKLDTFTRAFFETALWSSTDNSNDQGGEPLDKNYSISDLDPASVEKLAKDCEQFQDENSDDLSGADLATAGHDFWLTRNRHGAGFWDGDYPEPQATRLTDASHAYREVDLYIGDDGIIYAYGYEPNGEQLHFPFGSKQAGAMLIAIPTFDWKQIDGDVDPCSYGGTIARADGDQIDLIKIQPVREYVGDEEAKDVGFPFWTREATYDLDDLSLNSKEVQGALGYVGLKDDPAPLEDADPETRALMIAGALMDYGTNVDEGGGGFSSDIVKFPVKWYRGEPQTFEEYCGDEDEEFRVEVLGEGYTYKMTYETWDEEAVEAGETDDKGWVEEGSDVASLADTLRSAGDHNWLEWSDSNPTGRSWLISEEEQDMHSGERTIYNLWFMRSDGSPLSGDEIKEISKAYGISNFGMIMPNRRSSRKTR
jgi:hypothetical protein